MTLSEREKSLLIIAIRRVMNDSYHYADLAKKDKKHESFDVNAFASFMRDGDDASRLLTRLEKTKPKA